MLIESLFLTAHKWTDMALVAGSFGWKWRPYYQVPKVFNYSYGNQGLHVENVYDPFQDTAYGTGFLYNRMQDAVDLLGQGPNPTWVKERREMCMALEMTNRRLSYRTRPEWQFRSLESQGYWFKQFSLSLYAQFLSKYVPQTFVKFMEYKVFPPLAEKLPIYFQLLEHNIRKIDYVFANKSLGYHLMLDMFEQLNPPIDDGDKIVPYDYISIPGKRIIQGYKDFVYLSEMLIDLQREIKQCGDKYNDYVRIARQEKFKAMANGDPMAQRFIIPNFDEYCSKFLQYDIHTKTTTLIDLKRTIRDYRLHISLPDNAMSFIHKLWFSKNSGIYNCYWKDKYEVDSLQEALDKMAASSQDGNNINFNDKLNITDQQMKDNLKTINPYLKDYSTSKSRYEVNQCDKLSSMQRDIKLRYQESITRLSRDNVKTLKLLLGTDTDPFLEHQQNARKKSPTPTGKINPADLNGPRLYHPTDKQFDAEFAAVQANIMNEVYDILPSNITDKSFLEPIIQNYYNDRVNQYMYIHYPHLLETEIKEKLDLRYDKDALKVYTEYVHDRVQKRHDERVRKQQVLAPYKIIEKAFDYKHLYHINVQDHQVQEFAMQHGDDQPLDYGDELWGGEFIDRDNLKPGENLTHARYKSRQQHQYAQMLKDMEDMTTLELEKAKNFTLGTERHRNVGWLEQAANWTPLRRIKQGLPPLTSTSTQNERWDVSNVTKKDMTYVAKAFPGVSFDQFINVMDQQDTYQPIKKVSTGRREEFEWKGMPRNKDGGMSWHDEHTKDLLFKEKAKDLALEKLYASRLHTRNSDPRQMRHQFILSGDVEDQYQPPTM